MILMILMITIIKGHPVQLLGKQMYACYKKTNC